MKRASLSPEAENDLVDIWVFIATDDPVAADRFVDRHRERCAFLAESPGVGRERPELAAGLRSFPIGNYLIFYRLTADGIDVVRVLSGYRDLPSVVPGE